MDVQRMSYWDIAIIIRYPELVLVIQRISRDIEVFTCVRSYRQNRNISKYHMKVRNMLLFHYYIMKMNYFK